MEKRHLLKLLLLLPFSLFATTQTPFDLKRAHKRHRIKERWMNMWQSFHYFDYDSRDDMGYGVLRVLDDFRVAKLTGTPVHGHKNMEILTILLKGRLFHQDTLGHSGLIREGEIQLMSAGSGLKHAETNPSQFDDTLGLQIWISPKVPNATPYYQQKKVAQTHFLNRLYPLVSATGEEASLVINQDAFIYRGHFTKDTNITLKQRFKGNGFYLFIIEGAALYEKSRLEARDALGLNGPKQLELHCLKGCDLLIFEIPMKGAFY